MFEKACGFWRFSAALGITSPCDAAISPVSTGASSSFLPAVACLWAHRSLPDNYATRPIQSQAVFVFDGHIRALSLGIFTA